MEEKFKDWAEKEGFDLTKNTVGDYVHLRTCAAWDGFRMGWMIGLNLVP